SSTWRSTPGSSNRSPPARSSGSACRGWPTTWPPTCLPTAAPPSTWPWPRNWPASASRRTASPTTWWPATSPSGHYPTRCRRAAVPAAGLPPTRRPRLPVALAEDLARQGVAPARVADRRVAGDEPERALPYAVEAARRAADTQRNPDGLRWSGAVPEHAHGDER